MGDEIKEQFNTELRAFMYGEKKYTIVFRFIKSTYLIFS